jgi:hypothetical protein
VCLAPALARLTVSLSGRVTDAAPGRHLRVDVRVRPTRNLGAAAASQNFVPLATALVALHRVEIQTMARTKEKQPTNGAKRHLLNDDPFALKSIASRPSKKAKLLDDSDNSDAEQGGVELKVNDEYARRFEYNKKREEKHRRM